MTQPYVTSLAYSSFFYLQRYKTDLKNKLQIIQSHLPYFKKITFKLNILHEIQEYIYLYIIKNKSYSQTSCWSEWKAASPHMKKNTSSNPQKYIIRRGKNPLRYKTFKGESIPN